MNLTPPLSFKGTFKNDHNQTIKLSTKQSKQITSKIEYLLQNDSDKLLLSPNKTGEKTTFLLKQSGLPTITISIESNINKLTPNQIIKKLAESDETIKLNLTINVGKKTIKIDTLRDLTYPTFSLLSNSIDACRRILQRPTPDINLKNSSDREIINTVQQLLETKNKDFSANLKEMDINNGKYKFALQLNDIHLLVKTDIGSFTPNDCLEIDNGTKKNDIQFSLRVKQGKQEKEIEVIPNIGASGALQMYYSLVENTDLAINKQLSNIMSIF